MTGPQPPGSDESRDGARPLGPDESRDGARPPGSHEPRGGAQGPEQPRETAQDAVPPGYPAPHHAPGPDVPPQAPPQSPVDYGKVSYNTQDPVAPQPPAGPGVQPPFVAPPTQRDQRRMWAGIGIGAAALVLCVGGSIAGCIGLTLWLDTEQNQESEAAVGRYLNPLIRGEYAKAYLEQCADLRELETSEQYAARTSQRPKLLGYTITEAGPATDADPAAMVRLVRVQFRYESGTESGQFRVIHDQADKRYQVCGGDI
ncbi:hypothetical protein AB0M43_28410 [Longispora sp. NPDC051575]|uniref:hypothetical protein n=1 Tax=Longispora sp. NPDC051575 TaxID=3154943 RepID=UPI00341C6EF4